MNEGIKEYRPAYTVKAAYVENRVKDLRTWGMGGLLDHADKLGVKYRQNTKMEDLYRWVANHEWIERAKTQEDESPYAMEAVGEYPAADVTGVPWGEPSTVSEEMPNFDLEWDKAAEHAAQEYLGVRYGGERIGKFENWDSGPMLEKTPNPYNIQTESGWFIYEVVLPEVLGRFFKKNADYGDNHRTGLGVVAEFVGLHRKIQKLEKAFWLRQEMQGESPEEMLEDLVGQALIMLDLIYSGRRQ